MTRDVNLEEIAESLRMQEGVLRTEDALMASILKELKKMNLYLALVTDVYLGDEDVED